MIKGDNISHQFHQVPLNDNIRVHNIHMIMVYPAFYKTKPSYLIKTNKKDK